MRALAVMAVSVTAIALFGCKNGLGSTVLAEVIKSEEGPKDPVPSTEGMFGDFDENATFGDVALSNYATDLKYDWPDRYETAENGFMTVGLSGTVNFYKDGYYIPVFLGDGYSVNWGLLSEHYGNIYLAKVAPKSESWAGVYASVSKNGVDMSFHIGTDKVRFDTTGDDRPLVTTGDDISFFLDFGSVDITQSVDDYDNITVKIVGDLKSLTGDEMKSKYGDKYVYDFADGYYLLVTFHESFGWLNLKSDSSNVSFYSQNIGDSSDPTQIILYFADTTTSGTYTATFYGGDYDEEGRQSRYFVDVKVSRPEDDSDDPGTGTPDPDDPDEEDGEGDGGDQNLDD